MIALLFILNTAIAGPIPSPSPKVDPARLMMKNFCKSIVNKATPEEAAQLLKAKKKAGCK